MPYNKINTQKVLIWMQNILFLQNWQQDKNAQCFTTSSIYDNQAKKNELQCTHDAITSLAHFDVQS